ncbi:MAG TPA: hypothetical protein VII49_05275 [Rhizomicrobium sp.]
MTVKKLILDFSDRVLVPVDVNDVVQELTKRGVKDEIYFWPADLDGEKLRGQLVQTEEWEYPEDMKGNCKYCADIYFDRTMSDDWQRLVCCKELLHILDPEGCRVSTSDEVKRLFEKISLPEDMQDPLNDGHAANVDRLAIFQAVAILFPYATRELLMPKFQAGNLTIIDIARIVDLPLRYTSFVMNEVWANAYQALTL